MRNVFLGVAAPAPLVIQGIANLNSLYPRSQGLVLTVTLHRLRSTVGLPDDDLCRQKGMMYSPSVWIDTDILSLSNISWQVKKAHDPQGHGPFSLQNGDFFIKPVDFVEVCIRHLNDNTKVISMVSPIPKRL